MSEERKKRVLVADDEPNNLQVMKQILRDEHHLLFAKSGEETLQRAFNQLPDLILLDVMMPDMSGYEVCQQLKADPQTARIPVIFVTALNEVEDEARGFYVGAVDFLIKPVSRPIVRRRVLTHLSLVQVDELQDTRLEIVHRLSRAAEYKDNETGQHVIRMSHYSRVIAEGLGWSQEDCGLILSAAPMHDVGKIGVPDYILVKPGKLDEEEWKSMRRHPQIGVEILGSHDSPLFQMARAIALTHHEKWDGSGYPGRLAGENIPLVGRIVAVADVFDALTTKRPYKEAWPVERAVSLLQEEAGRHFDPDLIRVFLDAIDSVLEVSEKWRETN